MTKLSDLKIAARVTQGDVERLALLDWWLDNVGRIQLHSHSLDKGNTFTHEWILNPPGYRNQYRPQDVEDALVRIRERLKAPQYGVR